MLSNTIFRRQSRVGNGTQTPFPYQQLFVLGRSNPPQYLELSEIISTARMLHQAEEIFPILPYISRTMDTKCVR